MGPPGAVDWHALDADAARERLGVRDGRGLSADEAARRRLELGPNALPEPPPRSPLAFFLRQFASPLIYLLFVAAAIALSVGETRDAAVIVGVLLLNAIVGGIQEGRAERSMIALRRMATLRARAVRDGEEQALAASELVPGDLVRVAAGDAVPADVRLAEAVNLQVAEGALTGESLPVPKQPRAVPAETPMPDRRDMLFAGSQVTAGRGSGWVVATGSRTEVGRVALLAESAGHEPTPLERRLAGFGRYLAAGALLVFGLVLAGGLARGFGWNAILMVAISQLVSTVPEGLPVVMTVALAVGMRRMAERRAIVRRLAAVESLGSTSVICTDKTGTLTRNELTVTQVVLPDRRRIDVSGAGYAPEGALLHEGSRLRAGDPALTALLEAAALCNDAALERPGPGSRRWAFRGDPTEAALLALAGKAGLDAEAVRARWPRRGELPFSAESKMMATWHERAAAWRAVVKGAPELVVERCAFVRVGAEARPLDAAALAALRSAWEEMGSRGLRVLGFAEVAGIPFAQGRSLEDLGARAVFLGLAGQEDAPREDAADAVARCQRAGIRAVMVTGDHRATGLAVARTLGIAHPGDVAIDGRTLDGMSDEALRRELSRIAVFARVEPRQKLRIVEALQATGAVVAMTGDGVNDAPALARADVGVAMGLSGTEVAKQAAEIVLADDDFGTLVQAVAEGRLVLANLKKAILLLLSTGLAEIAVLMGAIVAGLPLPFVAVQILWNNVVTEGTITVNLAMEPPEDDEMRRPPTPRDEPILTRPMLGRMLVMAATITAVTLGTFGWRLARGAPLDEARTVAFTLLAVCEWFNVINCRSATRSALRTSLLRNRWLLTGLAASTLLQAAVVYVPLLQRAFHTVPLSAGDVLLVGALASIVLWVDEAGKLRARRRSRAGAGR